MKQIDLNYNSNPSEYALNTLACIYTGWIAIKTIDVYARGERIVIRGSIDGTSSIPLLHLALADASGFANAIATHLASRKIYSEAAAGVYFSEHFADVYLTTTSDTELAFRSDSSYNDIKTLGLKTDSQGACLTAVLRTGGAWDVLCHIPSADLAKLGHYVKLLAEEMNDA